MNEEGKNPLGFEVIDKRGRNNPVQEEPLKVVVREESPTKERRWESTGYCIVTSTLPDGTMMIQGRAVGLDQDGDTFLADYCLMPVVNPGFDWTIHAKQRLDTFLTCPCSKRNGPCRYHRQNAPHGWMKEDQQRLREQGDVPLPKALEVFFRMDRDRQAAQRVLIPRR